MIASLVSCHAVPLWVARTINNHKIRKRMPGKTRGPMNGCMRHPMAPTACRTGAVWARRGLACRRARLSIAGGAVRPAAGSTGKSRQSISFADRNAVFNMDQRPCYIVIFSM
jgi:hypothetical protein